MLCHNFARTVNSASTLRGDLSFQIEDRWSTWKLSMKMDHRGDVLPSSDGNEIKLNQISLINESASCSAVSSVDKDLNYKLERL